MSEEWVFRLLRWGVRLACGALLIASTTLAYVSAKTLSSDGERTALLAYSCAGLVTLGAWTFLRLTVYRHPIDDGGNYRTKEEVRRYRRSAWAVGAVGICLASLSSWPFPYCLALGIAGGTMASGFLYPAMHIVKTRPILSWRPGTQSQ
ncbi:MAG: hypothetical protein QOE83_2118 [Actinomycetota bacterium]|jgi:hypothetical protein|nr:hypothetical protein [Actinomycetota bacterium]